MTWNPDQNELDELLGAFALDAVEPEEAERLEDYLRENPRARAEVEEYREAAAFLAISGTEAPPGIWDRIAEQIEQPPEGQPAPLLDFRRRGGPQARPVRRRSTRRVWQWVAAAAAVIAVAGLTAEVVRQQNRLDDLQTSQDALAVSLDPTAQHFDLHTEDGTLAMRLAVRDDGETWIVGESLPTPQGDKEYQLWTIDGPAPVSVGVLGHSPEIGEFQADVTGRRYALSIEPKGGSPQPTEVVAASPEIQ
jgi:anti-sigma-K factor RskA